MADYVPFNTVPIQGRPWGPVAGVDAAIMEEKQREAQQFALEKMMLDNQMRGLEVDRYGQMTPHELAIKGHEANLARAKDPYVDRLALGAVGQADQQAAAGNVARGTQDSTIAKTNIENLLKGLEGTARQLELYGSMSPMMGQAEWQDVYNNMDPAMKRYFPKLWTPDIPQRLNRLSRMLQETPQFRGERELTNIREAGANERNKRTVDVQELNAWLNFLARLRQADATGANAGQIKTFEHYLTSQVEQFVRQGRISRDEGNRIIERMLQDKRAAAPGAIDPNAVVPQIFPNVGPRPNPSSAFDLNKQPTQGGGALSDDQAKQMLGPNYDPNYVYRQGPNGLERKKR